MKITHEDYATLEGLLKPVLERVPVATYRESNPEFSAKRVRWDYFWAIRPLESRNVLMNSIYQYMNDSHLDTALKSIVGL